MNKSKVFVFIAVLVLVLATLCACGNSEPAVNETQTNVPQGAVATNAVDSTLNVEKSEAGTETDALPEVSQGENDLDIITAPQEDVKASENAVATERVTEALDNPTESTEPSTTEVKKIELPFVPAH